MKYDTLELLCCPVCKGELTLNGQVEQGKIRDGILRGKECHHEYRIEAGIPHFATPRELVGLNSRYARLYNWISRLYDSDFFVASHVRRQFWPAGEEKARREVLGRLEISHESTVLETGIGTGSNIPYLSNDVNKVRVYGLDIASGMLRQCVKNLAKWGLEADLFLGNAEALPFKDETMDVVFHLGAINYFTEPKRAIAEMIRVAKAGTRIVFADETENVSDISERFDRIGERLFFGKQLAEEISRFRSADIVGLIPETMLDIRFESIWEGNGYRVEFRKP